jgi:hypothetical protein
MSKEENKNVFIRLVEKKLVMRLNVKLKFNKVEFCRCNFCHDTCKPEILLLLSMHRQEVICA